jgi:hypothetical protein
MSKAVICVATGRYVIGQNRLGEHLVGSGASFLQWTNKMPNGCPEHKHVPYGFKAYAIREAIRANYTHILWADACIVPCDLKPIWDLLDKQGYWISRNGYWNHEWTASAAYPLLGVTEEENKQIPHVVATAFAINSSHPTGQKIAEEYFRMATNGSFCGPWVGGVGVQHRHDQTALSVIAHRAGCNLTEPPAFFAYRGGETEETTLIADGEY